MTAKLLATAAAVAGCGFFVLTGQPAAPPAVFTAAQAAAGRTAYQSSCAQCHTDTLMGRDDVPPLAGADFMAKWGARTTKALCSRIQLAVGADHRSDEEFRLDLTAYILQANGAKPGTQPLTIDTAVEIRSVATGVAR
jgi:cytochrome c5